MTREEIIDVLEEIAVLLQLKGENAFKVRAYTNGARALETMEDELGERIEADSLTELNGIGSALAEKIATLYREGRLDLHEKLRQETPPGLLEMLEVPSLGPKKIKLIHDELGITTIAALEDAARDGRLAKLSGLGPKSAEKIAAGIANRKAYNARHLWWTAWETARPILQGLREREEIEMAEIGGSLRRGVETVGDLDFLAGSEDPEPVMEWFTSRENVAEVTARGQTKSSVRFDNGLQADLRVVPPAQFFFALHHFTGSKDHNVRMRQRALGMGYRLSEWGLTPSDEENGKKPLGPIRGEFELFKALGLTYIPPELREDMGEIEAAESGSLPELVKLEDLQGAFHNHTNASDGRHSLEKMAERADELEWGYLGIADHSKASFQANGLDEERLVQQVRQIRSLNTRRKYGVYLSPGVECDILPDGSLDLADEALEETDYVVASVHNVLNQDEDTMTKRILCALEHPLTTMLGHVTGRLLLRREPAQVNLGKIIDCAIRHGKIIELNAAPSRLDMDWRHWRRAAEKGLLTSINPDAHATDHFAFLRIGVLVARKGWLTKQHVLNTWNLDDVRAKLGQIRAGKAGS